MSQTCLKKFPDMPNFSFGQEGVEELFSNINSSKSGGPHHLPARFRKETATDNSPIFTILFNKSYFQGQPQQSWTQEPVCPIYKKGARSHTENYKLVSLTTIPCKIFEHIIVSKIWENLNEHGIITSQQHAFRTGMSDTAGGGPL